VSFKHLFYCLTFFLRKSLNAVLVLLRAAEKGGLKDLTLFCPHEFRGWVELYLEDLT